MPLTGTPVQSKGVEQRNSIQSFLGACAFGGTRISLMLRDKLVESPKPLIILIEVEHLLDLVSNRATKTPKIFPFPHGLPSGKLT